MKIIYLFTILIVINSAIFASIDMSKYIDKDGNVVLSQTDRENLLTLYPNPKEALKKLNAQNSEAEAEVVKKLFENADPQLVKSYNDTMSQIILILSKKNLNAEDKQLLKDSKAILNQTYLQIRSTATPEVLAQAAELWKQTAPNIRVLTYLAST